MADKLSSEHHEERENSLFPGWEVGPGVADLFRGFVSFTIPSKGEQHKALQRLVKEQ